MKFVGDRPFPDPIDAALPVMAKDYNSDTKRSPPPDRIAGTTCEVPNIVTSETAGPAQS